MHPLIKRILIRGTFVGVATIAIALFLRQFLETYLASATSITLVDEQGQPVAPGEALGLQGPIVFGLVGFGLLAVMEWMAYAREKAKQFKRQDSTIVKEGQARLYSPDQAEPTERAKI